MNAWGITFITDVCAGDQSKFLYGFRITAGPQHKTRRKKIEAILC